MAQGWIRNGSRACSLHPAAEPRGTSETPAYDRRSRPDTAARAEPGRRRSLPPRQSAVGAHHLFDRFEGDTGRMAAARSASSRVVRVDAHDVERRIVQGGVSGPLILDDGEI